MKYEQVEPFVMLGAALAGVAVLTLICTGIPAAVLRWALSGPCS